MGEIFFGKKEDFVMVDGKQVLTAKATLERLGLRSEDQTKIRTRAEMALLLAGVSLLVAVLSIVGIVLLCLRLGPG